MGEQPFTRLRPLIETLAFVMEPELHLPFAFYGHSMGSLIAFELARELHCRRGVGPQARIYRVTPLRQGRERSRP